MPFAHTAAAGGPNTEILLLGVGAVVVAALFFFQKSASRQTSLVLLVLGAAAITGAFTVAKAPAADEHHDVTLSVVSPAEGAEVPANETVTFELALEGAELAGESTDEDAGHVHVLVDGSTLDMVPTLDVEVELEPGEHEVTFEFVDAGHQPLDPPVSDSVTVLAG